MTTRAITLLTILIMIAPLAQGSLAGSAAGLESQTDLQYIISAERSHLTVNATVLGGKPNNTYAGYLLNIRVAGFDPATIAGGKVRVKSAETGYDSDELPLYFERDGQTMYSHWNTDGLPAGHNYDIYIGLEGTAPGNSSPDQTYYGTDPDATVYLNYPFYEPRVIAAEADASSDALGLPLGIERSYVHDALYDPPFGPFGWGWTYTYDVYLEEHTDGGLALHGPGGVVRFFDSLGGGQYPATPGDDSFMTRDPDGTFLLTEKNGLKYHFRPDLRLDYIQDLNGNRVMLSYNDRNQVVEIRHSNGQKYSLQYNDQGRISKLVDDMGRETSYAYDADGQYLRQVTDFVGRVTSYTYQPEDGSKSERCLLSITYPDNTHTYFGYDRMGRLAYTSGDNGTGRLTFDYGDKSVTVKSQAGSIFSFLLNSLDWLMGKSVKAMGSADELANATHIMDAYGGTTIVVLDEHLRPALQVSPTGGKIYYTYDVGGNLISVTDPLNRTTRLYYDDRGNVVKITGADGNDLTYGYNSTLNRLTWFRDSNENIVEIGYDGNGNPVIIRYPDGIAESVIYDYGNHAQRVKKRDGSSIFFDMDGNGLILSKSYTDKSIFIYGYDSMGRIIKATGPSGAMTFTYDNANRLSSVSYPGNRTFLYEYNAADQLTKATDPDGRSLYYSYDSSGRLVQITDDARMVICEYVYDNANRLKMKTLGNGVRTTYEYDSGGHVTAITSLSPSGSVISSYKYTYDLAGRRTSVETPAGVESYAYDPLDRLVKVVRPGGHITEYSYDAMGNRILVKSDGAAEGYAVNDLNQYTSIGSAHLSYDKNGNLISRVENGEITDYQYDAEDRLIGVTGPNGKINYGYDPLGRLYSRTTGEGTTYYLWQGDQIVLAENGAHSTIARYYWGTSGDEIVRMDTGGTSYYYDQDALSSVTDLTDIEGNPIEHYSYSAFGEPTAISTLNSWRYTGLMYDAEAGLQYNRNRFYAPDQGRFISADPMGLAGGPNLYAYTSNDPVNNMDPTGLRLAGDIADWIDTAKEQMSQMDETKTQWNKHWALQKYEQGIPEGQTQDVIAMEDTRDHSFEIYPADPPVMYDHNGHYRAWPERASGTGAPAGGMCPTFIQLPPDQEGAALPPTYLNVTDEVLAARMTVPVDGALVRSDVPIFGVAGGTDFKEYRVEYGKGLNPTEWHLINASTTPQNIADTGLAEVWRMQGDADIHGNLATWNTGLKNWEHLPWHPGDDPTDMNGVYTIRLTVTGKHGEIRQDTMTVQVGRTIANCLPGTALSDDGRVTLRFTEQSIMVSFRVYTIIPVTETGETLPAAPDGLRLLSPAYTIREPGDRFTKDVRLEFNTTDPLARTEPGRVGIMRYDNQTGRWLWLETTYASGDNQIFSTTLTALPADRAIYALGYDSQDLSRSSPEAPTEATLPIRPLNSSVLVENTFETDTDQWVSRDHYVGALVSRDDVVTADGSRALKLTNPSYGGSFGVTVLNGSYDVAVYPIMSFDYRVDPGVKTDFYVLSEGRWYNVRFTDDPIDFYGRDVNVGNAGRIEGIVADGQWHHASVDLARLLKGKTGHTRVEAIAMADYDVTGYMKLDFGHNPAGASYYIDNFVISRASASVPSDDVIVDSFEAGNETNLLGGANAVYSSGGTDYCQASITGDPYAADNHALQLDFNVSQPGAYAGYYTAFNSTCLCGSKELTFRIYSPGDIPPMYVGLRYQPWIEAKVPVQFYTGEPDEGGWRNITVPLSAFTGLPEYTTLDGMFLTFTSEASSGTGCVLVDDLRMSKNQTYGQVADFDQHSLDGNLLGQRFDAVSTEGASISYSQDAGNGSLYDRNSSRITYGGSIGSDFGEGRFSYAYWEAGFNGFDATGFDYLVIEVRGEKGGEKPNVWISDGTTRKPVLISPLNATWQEVRIPLKAFEARGIDLSHLDSMQLVFEWAPMEGTIYVADIHFE